MTERPPPPIPATIREKLKAHNPGDKEHPIVPSRKIIFASKRLVLRPKMSERRPYSAWKAVLEMMYATAIQETLFRLWKSEPLLSEGTTKIAVARRRGLSRGGRKRCQCGYMRGKIAARTVKSKADKKLQTRIAMNVSLNSVPPPESFSRGFPPQPPF